MGQTLTHGVYLPDEGERNCYSGLAGNWTILDGAVGTIAEHTTQIAGKAPAVHTHTKSDVTDLLNSNFIPSANNSYDLGSSSYQWNNVYSKGYYYNGTAWGLDKANEWTNINYFALNLHQKGFSSRVAIPASNEFGALNASDNSNAPLFSINYANRASGERDISFRVYNTSGNANGAMIRKDASNNYSFCSIDSNNTISLGTSTNKWKSFNGINPGALSLPGSNSGINTDNWDKTGATVNSYTPAVDGWLVLRCKDVAGDYLFATWSGGAMRASVTGQGLITVPAAGLCVYIPVKAGTTVACVVKATDKFGAYIYPCQGNV